jgi:hypothetical protein
MERSGTLTVCELEIHHDFFGVSQRTKLAMFNSEL